MPKVNNARQKRKRKHVKNLTEDIEYVIDEPKAKFRPFDEEAQAEEEQLSNILFGATRGFLQSLEEAEQEAGPSRSNIDSGVGEDDSNDSEENVRKPAWVDEDDGIEVGEALDAQGRKLPNGGINSRSNKYYDLLRHKFISAFGTPEWASLDKKRRHSESDSDDEILRTTGFISKKDGVTIPQGVLEFKKVKDLNRDTYTEGPHINAIEFHHSSSVALVAGNGGIATLFAVDGKKNNKLHSVGFERFPIVCARFIQNGNEALLGSRHNFIYSYDLLAAKAVRINLPTGLTQFKKFVTSPDSQLIAAAGKWGEVHLISSLSKERISLLKQDSDVTALTFNHSGNLLFGHSDTGEVTVWDMNTRRVKHKFIDEGCLQGTTIAASSSNQFLAAGSAQGVVNVYNMEDVLQQKLPKPKKTIYNLTTSVSSLKFNPSSEILALASFEIEKSIKLFHIASETVFSNFPIFSTKMGHINSLNFSPGSGYLAFGDRKSVVSLYRLKHYKNY